MSLLVAVQADPLEKLNLMTDSTLLLARAAQRRGHKLFFYEPGALSLEDGNLSASGFKVLFAEGTGYETKSEKINLSDAQILFLRQEPPFDMSYITSTYLLEHLTKRTFIVNHPSCVRDMPEKLFVTHFPGLLPPTLVSSDRQVIQAFLNKYGKVVAKPLYLYGGKGVFLLDQEDVNCGALLDYMFAHEKLPWVFQEFIPSVKEGDKRILLLDGETIGFFKRVPASNSVRSNLMAGGHARQTTLTPRDQEIIHQLGPILKQKGIFFAGLDIIGSYVVEINVTCPTGIFHYNKLTHMTLEDVIWEKIESHYQTYFL